MKKKTLTTAGESAHSSTSLNTCSVRVSLPTSISPQGDDKYLVSATVAVCVANPLALTHICPLSRLTRGLKLLSSRRGKLLRITFKCDIFPHAFSRAKSSRVYAPAPLCWLAPQRRRRRRGKVR